MVTPPELREMLLQYRLHELDEVRREEIDARLIADPDFSAAMQEAEYDLLDAYAARELSETDRLRVERALHPAGRFSPEAAGHVIGSPRAASSNVVPIRPISSTASAHPRWTLLWTVAAVLAIGSVVVFSLDRTHRSGPQQAVANLAPPAPAPAAAPAASQAPAPAAPSPETTFAEVILPRALRSKSSLALKIAPTVTTVRFLYAGASAERTYYDLQLVGDDGSLHCRSRGIGTGRNHIVQFSCPAAQIPSGSSFLRVLALSATPDDAPLLEITVSVSRSNGPVRRP